VRLEEAHLPYLLSPYARGSDVGDRARCKLKAGVRSVHAMRQDWNPYGPHVRHLNVFAYEPLHYVQIVNHQIKHNVYV